VQKPGRALALRIQKFGQKKKNFKPSLQNASAPNFDSRCICVEQGWVASAKGCAFLEFDESLHDA